METLSKEQEIIKLLFKDFLTYYNSRNISKIIKTSHAGAFRILKRLEKRNIVKPTRIGKAIIYSLNKENPIAWREIEMVLTLESQHYLKWIEEFRSIENKVKFVIFFGSITRDEKSAKDIDLLVIAAKDKFDEIKRIIEERNGILPKKIHLLLQTYDDFKKDVKSRNKAMIEIIKNGIILFGQDEARKALL
ncbi:nucleotidyltransferase domain-containing protein [Candidatus Woesearchaeota archaeon]|nr:nucleotidyltransferase domain-containing protein [Candidatus Woesearchaeota archaeon]